jgi:hypothetical protein
MIFHFVAICIDFSYLYLIKYSKNDLLIIRSAHYSRFRNEAYKYMVLGSLEDNRFKDSCTSEVKLLAKKDFTYESDKKQSYSLLITDSVPEINYIAKNNFSKVILETSNAKKAEMLLSGKVQLLSALSFENDGFVRLEPFLMTLLKENKVKLNTAKTSIPKIRIGIRASAHI